MGRRFFSFGLFALDPCSFLDRSHCLHVLPASVCPWFSTCEKTSFFFSPAPALHLFLFPGLISRTPLVGRRGFLRFQFPSLVVSTCGRVFSVAGEQLAYPVVGKWIPLAWGSRMLFFSLPSPSHPPDFHRQWSPTLCVPSRRSFSFGPFQKEVPFFFPSPPLLCKGCGDN